MASAISLNDAMAPPLPIHRFTVEQYRQLGDIGMLTPEDRVELLEGWLVKKMNQRPIHGFIVGLLNAWFQQELPTGWIVRCQLPITTEHSEPEPDLTILKGAHADFRHQHPGGLDCRLVVEIADTSLDKDRAKASIYCQAGVEEYWIVNVAEKCLERYRFSDVSENAEPEMVQADAISIGIGGRELTICLRALFE